jgi:large subunit ribosomal protein L31
LEGEPADLFRRIVVDVASIASPSMDSAGSNMKDGIHPKYVDCTVTCGCGNTFKTRSTKPKIIVEVCAKCHPFFTGSVKFVDAAGRVDKFNKKFQGTYGKGKKDKAEAAKA